MSFPLTFKRNLRKVLHYFDAGFVQQYMFLALGDSRETAIKSLKLKSGDKLLEVGVGQATSLDLYPRDIHVTAVDYSAVFIEKAKKRAAEMRFENVHFFVMNAQKMRLLKDGSFDAVLSNSLLSVVPEPEKALAEMVRLCKPGGHIAVTCHFMHQQGWRRALDKAISTTVQRFLGYQTTLPETLITQFPGVEVLERKEYPLPYTPHYVMCVLFVLRKR